MKNNDDLHTPVLLDSVVDYLSPKEGERYLDLTAGYGGHASRILEAVKDSSLVTLVDRDEFAIEKLQPFMDGGCRLLHESFSDAAARLKREGETYDMILMDLGVSSPQLDNPERGFSFRFDAPLDMRMDTRSDKTAAEVINFSTLEELSLILRDLGEESRYSKIAKSIIDARPISSTKELADIIESSVGRPRGRSIHPATRTFQALRIAVNNEIDQIERTLPILPDLLKPGGRLVVISFHSLEDSLVKHFFKERSHGYEAQFTIITKKPIQGADLDSNPRARSAKLRAVVKK